MTNGLSEAQLLDARDVADLLKCKYRTVQKLVADGTIPVVKIPGSRLLRFRSSAIADVLTKFEGFRSPRSPFDDGPGAVGAMAT